MKRYVVMVTSQYPPVYGGAGEQCELLSRELVAMGWQVDIVCLDQLRRGSEKGSGKHVLRLPSPVGRSHVSRAVSTVILGLVAGLRVLMFRPGVVHIHGCYWWSIPSACAARLVGSKLVIKCTRDGEDDPMTVRRKRLGPFEVGRIYSLPFELADEIVVLNTAAENSGSQAGYGSKLRRMTNAVDVQAFYRTPDRRTQSREKFGLNEATKVILFVGYLVRHKGFFDLLQAVVELNTDTECEVWLVGPYKGFYRELSDEVQKAVEQTRQASGLKIRLFGHIEHDEIPSYFWASDVYVLPSYSEGMPNSLLEAMVAGCQAVTSSIPGIVEVATDDEVFFNPPGDVTGLAFSLACALRRDVAKPNRVAERVSSAVVAVQYESMYLASR